MERGHVVKYKNLKNGHPVKMTDRYSLTESGKKKTKTSVGKYKYDSKGNAMRLQEDSKEPTVRTFAYKGNRAKSMSTDGSSKYLYTWKKVKVPKSLVGKVKAQQWSLVNRNLNHAFGPVSLSEG